ncbi:MAG TPA: MarR family transcriptional regulator [Chloroflexota bacterium]|jgi:DNA-binding MarR family transcriptional regulator|nr:MarR family transcriptional regulator [Chloroflexota bacterium]
MDGASGAPPARLRRLASRLVNLVALHANRLVDARLGAVDARRYHYALLAALEEFGPASQVALGRRSGIDRSDVVATINELCARGFVERTPDPADRRRNVITITPAGRQQLRRLEAILDEAQDALLAPLSAAEREELRRLLTRVVDHHASW